MAVAWYLGIGNKFDNEIWKNFKNAMIEKSDFTEGGDRQYINTLIDIITKELAVYGAYTDWNVSLSPIWFPDEESLVMFKLAWS
jgi:hypothetical protein